ncbi:PilN domain-containing protein [Rhizobium sp. 3T7]|uniref:PilN domain-containing protein n=1 Tax=Rhizobium sp. 3T7 TaxID=2874922 RepID=UPI001CCC6B76|nr:PilN domain-containing protein [Rhizobium sp. 3T7]MBZ9790155.1 PilN domain-containing protein [Rhizobium sp. 3T7]
MTGLTTSIRRSGSALLGEMVSWQAAANIPRRNSGTFLVVEEPTKLVCYRASRAGPIHKAEGPRDDLTWLSKVVGNQPIEVRLGADRAVVRSLKLPAASRNHIDAIIRHQLEQLVPWPADRMTFDYDLQDEEAASPSDQLHLRVVAVSLSAMRSAIDPFSAAGVKPVVVGLAADPLGKASAINLLPGAKAALTERRSRIALLSLCVLAAIGTFMITVGGWRLHQEMQEAKRIEASLVSLRSTIDKARQKAEQADSSSVKLARKWDAAPMVVLMDELSKIIPETTYLTTLDVADRDVRIAGFSTDAASLIRVIEDSDMLEAANFSAPVVRNGDNGKERFEILARLVGAKTQ